VIIDIFGSQLVRTSSEMLERITVHCTVECRVCLDTRTIGTDSNVVINRMLHLSRRHISNFKFLSDKSDGNFVIISITGSLKIMILTMINLSLRVSTVCILQISSTETTRD